jgi:hypothetical protein
MRVDCLSEISPFQYIFGKRLISISTDKIPSREEKHVKKKGEAKKSIF